MSSFAAPTSARNLLRRFARNRKGSAAVEFALVAPVFIALLFAIVETAIMFFASQILETVTQESQFANLSVTLPVTNGAFDPTKLNFNMGGSCSVVLVTLYYQWQMVVTGLGYNISNLNGNKRLLSATAAFRNEPYAGACTS
jgi:Flp pilus assembly pilin Flp